MPKVYENQGLIQQVFLKLRLYLQCSVYIYKSLFLRNLKYSWRNESNKHIKEHIIKNKIT